jgi:phosphoribosylglycinamide formyltransferase-1
LALQLSGVGFGDDIHEILTDYRVDFIVLAGFMRILTESFISRWENKIINIHPSLLPAFKGLHTHERAIEYGVKYHGCTVHFVTPGLDDGPIISQNVVAIRQDDTPDILAHRVLCCEHTLLPYCLDIVCRDAFKIEDRRVTIL